MKKNLMIGTAGLVMVLGLGAIGVATVRRDTSALTEAADTRKPRSLPFVSDASRIGPNAALSHSIDALRATADQRPGDAEAWKHLGAADMQGTRYDAAVDAYKKALAIAPQDGVTWSALGEAYTHAIDSSTSKMPALARDAFDKALSFNPQDVRARFYIALEKDYQGQHDAAIGDWLAQLRAVPAGSGPDVAIRAAILDSLNRNIRLVSKAVEASRQLQPKPPVSKAAAAKPPAQG